MGFEWDAAKAKANFRNYGVRFEESKAVFDDPHAGHHCRRRGGPDGRTVRQYRHGRFRRVLIVVYTCRGDNIRIISARVVCAARERAEYEAGLR